MTLRGFTLTVSVGMAIWPLAACTTSPTAPTPIITSTASVASLPPADGSISSLMAPGETKRFVFWISNSADLLVELSWPHSTGASLRMSVEDDDSLVSNTAGALEVLVLPRGKRGTLIVQQDGPAVSQPITFTLRSLRIAG